jgi:hypothetical protein
MKNSKKAQMEMSVGTIVTIVLLMTVLILGLVLVRTIFKGATSAVDLTDQQLTNQINQFFAEDDNRKIVVYPQTGEISIKKGDEGGFGFSIRNLNREDGSFSYEIKSVEASCSITLAEADNLIVLGKTRQGINIPSGSAMDSAILIKFLISENIPLCNIRYGIDVKEGNLQYGNTVTVDVNVRAN